MSDPIESAVYLRGLRRGVIQNTLRLLEHEDAVHKVDPDHFTVVPLRGTRRVGVMRRGDLWRCRVDKEYNQEKPCSHILAVLIYEGLVDLPNTAAGVYRKGDQGRDHNLERRAWELVPTMAPAILAKMLRQGLPAILDRTVCPGRGRPAKAVHALAYQSIMRVLWRKSHKASRGDMRTRENMEHNPYGACGVATACRFMADLENKVTLEKLLALSSWPARKFESLFHPDGTGLTEQHFSAYFDERYDKQKRKKREAEIEAREIAAQEGRKYEPQGPRKHHWTFGEFLWSYNLTMVAAVRTQQGPFGEAPWLIPLLERARLMLNIEELGGDKAYDANYIFRYARERGIDAQIKIRRTPIPSYSYSGKKYRKAKMLESRLDPEGYAAKANRRNNAETGNHAFKAILGDQIYSKGAVAQDNEILCMCIAYNLTRLVYLHLKEGVEIDFAGGAEILRTTTWVPLETLHQLARASA